MYQVMDLVVYSVHGVCKIIQMEDRVIDRHTVSYYVLEPLAQPASRYLVPSHNPVAVGKIRPLMTPQALLELLRTVPNESDWIPDEGRRKQLYREILSSGDAAMLLRQIMCLHQHKKTLDGQGRRLHLSDENFLREAEKILFGEISVVLNISQKDVPSYVYHFID